MMMAAVDEGCRSPTLNNWQRLSNSPASIRERPACPPLLSLSTDKMHLLTKDNWIEWNSLLCSVLGPYLGAVEILTGTYTINSRLYSHELDRQLLSLVHRLISVELQHIVRMVIRHEGPRGSLVYQALRKRYAPRQDWNKKTYDQITHSKSLKISIDTLGQDKEEPAEDYIFRAEELFFLAEEDGIIWPITKKLKHIIRRSVRQRALVDALLQESYLPSSFPESRGG